MDLISDGILWNHITNAIMENSSPGDPIWTNGNRILCKDEAAANTIADFLDLLGYCSVTGYFDPEEDEKNGDTDEATGYYYVDV